MLDFRLFAVKKHEIFTNPVFKNPGIYNFVCFGGISLMRTLCDAYYYVYSCTYIIRQGNTNLK